MDISVKKPSVEEVDAMKKNPTWGCGVSEFNWHYDSEETSLVTEGEVEVSYSCGSAAGKSVKFGAGDLVVFPQGLSCVWKVIKPVKKHYVFK
jgi:uncharacterized cupin superfamily protein